MNITDRKFGVEIEFKGVNRLELVAVMRNKGLNCEAEGYNHITRRHWKIVTDASVHNGYEIVSPILTGENGMNQLKLVCEALNELGATVDRSCGVHVHLDARDLTAREVLTIYKRYGEHEEQIDLCMPRSRRADNGTYCRGIKDIAANIAEMDKPRLSRYTGRFHKINLTNLTGSGSLEFRQHSGTTEFKKIGNWIAFLMQFVAKSQRVASGTTTQNFSSIARRAWFAPLRRALQDMGFDLHHKRYSNKWIITHPNGATNEASFATIEHFLAEDVLGVLAGGKEFERAAKTAEIGTFAAQAFLKRTTGLTREAILDMAEEFNSRPNAETDEGWLDGIDADVTDYLNARREELS